MFHIFIKTPLYKNSNYVPHIIEHCVIPLVSNPNIFFETSHIRWEVYTYYTNFFLDTDSQDELDAFVAQIQKPLTKKRIQYEQAVIRDEVADMPYNKKIINKIGEKIYGSPLKYSQTHRVSFEEIDAYHQKYYTPQNIVILENDAKSRDISLGKYTYSKTFDIRSREGTERVFLFDYTMENLYITTMLAELFDEYLHYHARHIASRYFSSEVFVWEFESAIFLSIEKHTDLKIIRQIPENFISAFVEYKLSKFEKIDFSEVDGVSMIQFGYVLSECSKREIYRNLMKYKDALWVPTL